MSESFLNGRVLAHHGDCLAVLPTLAENSIDSCVCDPPYHLTSIVKRFGADDAAPAKSNGATGVYGRAASGFMGKKWDGGDIAFDPETWRAVYRVLKPGAHLLACGGTRTYHRMACAIEDAGFEIRDCVQWIYGSGFPKSHDVSKGIDKAAGAEREVVGERVSEGGRSGGNNEFSEILNQPKQITITGPATPEAQWQGWGTALKPACELIVLARKPLSEKTVAANVLRWGTGALNIGACRVAASDKTPAPVGQYGGSTIGPNGHSGIRDGSADSLGRWPANVIHDGSDEVVGMFPETKTGTIDPSKHVHKNGKGTALSGSADGSLNNYLPHQHHDGDAGSAARFFYTAKADSTDRIGSKHPTVKPLDLIQYLIRLVTPPGGLVLDLFAGTGTTGEAAFREGMRAVLIERESEYFEDIRRRMALVLAGPDERSRESIKAKLKDKPIDAGPLFADTYDPIKDIWQGEAEARALVKERMAAGGEPWPKREGE